MSSANKNSRFLFNNREEIYNGLENWYESSNSLLREEVKKAEGGIEESPARDSIENYWFMVPFPLVQKRFNERKDGYGGIPSSETVRLGEHVLCLSSYCAKFSDKKGLKFDKLIEEFLFKSDEGDREASVQFNKWGWCMK